MLEKLINSLNEIVAQTHVYWLLMLSVLGVLFLIHFINVALQYRLLALGIRPRHLSGLPGIIFAPFLHGNFNHLFFNAIPLIVLMDFILVYSEPVWIIATCAIILLSGILTWLFGRDAIHVGASGVITGYWGFLVFLMIQHPTVLSVVLGIICVYYFAGILFGILPLRESTSWEGHLFGLISGILTAWVMTLPIFYSFMKYLFSL